MSMRIQKKMLNSEKKPMRRCIVCRTSKPSDELIRFTLQDGIIVKDVDKAKDGRGMYLCNNKECIELAIKKQAFSRVCKMNVDLEELNV